MPCLMRCLWWSLGFQEDAGVPVQAGAGQWKLSSATSSGDFFSSITNSTGNDGNMAPIDFKISAKSFMQMQELTHRAAIISSIPNKVMTFLLKPINTCWRIWRTWWMQEGQEAHQQASAGQTFVVLWGASCHTPVLKGCPIIDLSRLNHPPSWCLSSRWRLRILCTPPPRKKNRHPT